MDIRSVYKNYQEGGLVSGEGAMPHDMGGVPTVDGSGEQVAEIEGGERIFSIEDTQQMEAMAQGIMSAQDENQQMQMAAELGMFVVEAISRQEQVNPSEEVPAEMGMEQGMGQDPMMGGGQPMMKYGGKIQGFEAIDLD